MSSQKIHYNKHTTIPFNNNDTKDKEKLSKAFETIGLKVEDFHTECFMWVYVLCDDGSLWLLDKSHGGGGFFSLEKY